jgi:hypothetical protein
MSLQYVIVTKGNSHTSGESCPMNDEQGPVVQGIGHWPIIGVEYIDVVRKSSGV